MPAGNGAPALRPAHDDDGWEVIALIGACWSEYPGCVMDVHGECPDLLAPASAYHRLGGAFWVATDPCGTVIATVGWRPLDASTAASNTEIISIHNTVTVPGGDVRDNYFMTGTTWTINGAPPNGSFSVDPTKNEVGTSLLANTTMEKIFASKERPE